MPRKPSEGFVKCEDRFLPYFSGEMLAEFYCSDVFMAPEVRNKKAMRATRAEYSDNAIGFVEVKREEDICTLKAKITPEHRVHEQYYSVYCIINEREESVIKASCEGCAAAAGGCKHVIAFVSWLHRKSCEVSRTSEECQWKKPRLSTVGSTMKSMLIDEFGASSASSQAVKETPSDNRCLRDIVVCNLQKEHSDAIILKSESPKSSLSMHHLVMAFKQTDLSQDGVTFRQFCSSRMDEQTCNQVANETLAQKDSSEWFAVRYGRVTASRLWDVSRCQTTSGTLVSSILGASGVQDTAPMKRGRLLEPQVLQVLNKQFGGRLTQTGLLLNSDMPEFGASPDGLLNDLVVEVKCPLSEKTRLKYFNSTFNEPSPKCKAQIMLQMKFSGKNKGIFCVASPDFENNKSVDTLVVERDDSFLMPVIEQARSFWLQSIFPRIYDSV